MSGFYAWRRLTALTTLIAIMFLVYNFALTSVQVQQDSGQDVFVREGRLLLTHTQTPTGVVGRPFSNCSNRGVKKYPSALIIGVRKGGTRALIDMLKCHPDIVAATSEVHYFDRDENFAKGVQWYLDQMPFSTKAQRTIEKSPSYFVSRMAAERAHTISPSTKIILIVRNPLDRIMSDYTQLLRKGRSSRSFENDVFLSPSGEVNTAFYPMSISMYDVHFERWREYFDLSQILIVDGDALIRDPVGQLKKVEEFMKVDNYFRDDMFYFNSTKGFYCWKKFGERGLGRQVSYCLGSAKGHRLPQVSNDTVQRLLSFLRPHNERFFAQVKQRFDWDFNYRNVGTHSKF